MSYFKTCPNCGANLDPGEICDCGAAQTNNQRFNQLLNRCAHPRAMYNALLALGSAGLLDKEKAAQSATNTQDGGAEHVDHAVSTSNDTTN